MNKFVFAAAAPVAGLLMLTGAFAQDVVLGEQVVPAEQLSVAEDWCEELQAQQGLTGTQEPETTMTDEQAEEFKAPIREQYEHQGNPYYSTARLWDDGVIDPADTRTVLGLALSVVGQARLEPVSYGVFRM